MSISQVSGNQGVDQVGAQGPKRMDVTMKYFLALADRAQLNEDTMQGMVDSFRDRTQRIRDFTTLKAALQELDGLCQSKKPDEDIQSILNSNPALKSKIDSLSEKLGVRPFESTTATSPATASASAGVGPSMAQEALPASVTEETLKSITPDVFKYLTDDSARKSLMQTLPFGGQDTYLPSNESKALEKKGGVTLLNEVRDFMKSPAGKDLIKYMDRNGELGAARLRQEVGQGVESNASAQSATEGVIPKSQIEAAKTRMQGEIEALGSEQSIDSMKLNHINGLRTACYDGMAAMIRNQRELAQSIWSR